MENRLNLRNSGCRLIFLRCTQSTVGRACSCLPACKGVTRRVQRLSGGSNISFQVPSLHCTDPYVCLTSFLAEGSFARSRVSRRGGGTERACSSTPADCNARGRRDPWSRPRPRRHPCERPAGAYEHLRVPMHSGACMGRCVRVLGMTPTYSLSTDRQVIAGKSTRQSLCDIGSG